MVPGYRSQRRTREPDERNHAGRPIENPFPWFASKPESFIRRIDRIARIMKFGLSGTDMPGHELLSDREIASLSLWLTQGSQPINKTSGETI